MISSGKFYKFFPPPQFLVMPAAGIDISDRSIRFVEMSYAGSRIALKRYGEVGIPRGAIVGGEIQDEAAVRDVLVGMKKTYGLDIVRASLPEQKGYVMEIDVPTLKHKELRGSLEIQLPEHVPLAPQDAVFDYQTADCPGGGDEVIKTGVTVMPRETIFNYLSLFKKAGMTVLSFELEAHAIARAIIPRGSCETFMIADIGATRTGIFIISNGVLQLTFTVGVGGNLITSAIAKTLKVSFKEAVARKEEDGIVRGEKKKEVVETVAGTIATLRDEIKKHYTFWHTHSEGGVKEGKRPIKRILLCGGETNVPGLREFIAEGLAVPVGAADPWQNIISLEEYIPPMPRKESLRYATALGLSMRSFLEKAGARR